MGVAMALQGGGVSACCCGPSVVTLRETVSRSADAGLAGGDTLGWEGAGGSGRAWIWCWGILYSQPGAGVKGAAEGFWGALG